MLIAQHAWWCSLLAGWHLPSVLCIPIAKCSASFLAEHVRCLHHCSRCLPLQVQLLEENKGWAKLHCYNELLQNLAMNGQCSIHWSGSLSAKPSGDVKLHVVPRCKNPKPALIMTAPNVQRHKSCSKQCGSRGEAVYTKRGLFTLRSVTAQHLPDNWMRSPASTTCPVHHPLQFSDARAAC